MLWAIIDKRNIIEDVLKSRQFFFPIRSDKYNMQITFLGIFQILNVRNCLREKGVIED